MFPLILPLVLYTSLTLAQTCYLPNRRPLPSNGTFFPAFAPCTSGGPSTVCCATNRTREPGGDARDGEVKDECLPNGLCQNRRVKSGVEGLAFFANYCTDPTYPSSKCLDICPSIRGDGGNARVTPCTGKADSETWCCGESKDCCASGLNVVRIAKILGQAHPSLSSSLLAVASSSISSAGSRSASASAISTAGATSSSSSGQGMKKEEKGLKGGAIAGIVVGALAILLLIAAIVVIKKRRSNRKSDALLANNEQEVPPPQYDAAEHRVEKDARGLVELETPMSELPGTEAREAAGSWPHVKGVELDSRAVKRVS